MTIGTKTKLLILWIVMAVCFANAARRLVYVAKNYTLDQLIQRERGKMK